MYEYLHLSPTPIDESCQQVGSGYDHQKARAECRAFINQLKRTWPDAPVEFKILSQNHDFGSYLDVIVSYDDNDDDATDAAYEIEGDLPEKWDAEARTELGLVGYVAVCCTTAEVETFKQTLSVDEMEESARYDGNGIPCFGRLALIEQIAFAEYGYIVTANGVRKFVLRLEDDEPDENATDIRSVLRRRDGLSAAEADRVVAHLKERMVEAIANGEDPSDVLADEVGLEPDFIDELL